MIDAKTKAVEDPRLHRGMVWDAAMKEAERVFEEMLQNTTGYENQRDYINNFKDRLRGET